MNPVFPDFGSFQLHRLPKQCGAHSQLDVLPCSRTTMVNWASSFPRNGLQVRGPTLILRPVWVGVHCKFGRPKTFRENHLTTSELHWKFLIWSICKNGVHGITWAGFLRVFPAMRASFQNGLPTLGPTCFSTSYYQLLNHLRPNASFPKPHITNKDIGFLPKAAQWSLSFLLGHPNKHEQVSLCSGNWYGFVWNSNGVPRKFPWIIIPLSNFYFWVSPPDKAIWGFPGMGVIEARWIVYFVEHPYLQMDDWRVAPF